VVTGPQLLRAAPLIINVTAASAAKAHLKISCDRGGLAASGKNRILDSWRRPAPVDLVQVLDACWTRSAGQSSFAAAHAFAAVNHNMILLDPACAALKNSPFRTQHVRCGSAWSTFDGQLCFLLLRI